MPHDGQDRTGSSQDPATLILPDLLELTRTAQKAILEDIEKGIQSVVDTKKSDYALITGIQIHGPEDNYVEPGTCYAMIDELRYELTQHF